MTIASVEDLILDSANSNMNAEQYLSTPLRFTVCTYNIWTWTRWPERREALAHFARAQRPDVLCLQELQNESRELLDEVLGDTHDRVHDDFEGWTQEGNIYWNRRLFDLVNYGATDVGILESLRRLFWVRLRSLGTGKTLIVSTAHFTWSGHADLLISEKNARIPQARRSLFELDAMLESSEPQLFMGDFNDSNEPIRVLTAGGFTDCFSAIGRVQRATYPALPTASGPEQTIDWMMHRGLLRCLTAEVVDFYHSDLAPSDHKPVVATYELS